MRRMDLFQTIEEVKGAYVNNNFSHIVTPNSQSREDEVIRVLDEKELLSIVHQEVSFGTLETSTELIKDLDAVYKGNYKSVNDELRKLRLQLNDEPIDSAELYTDIFASIEGDYSYNELKTKSEDILNTIEKEYYEGYICVWNIRKRIEDLVGYGKTY